MKAVTGPEYILLCRDAIYRAREGEKQKQRDKSRRDKPINIRLPGYPEV